MTVSTQRRRRWALALLTALAALALLAAQGGGGLAQAAGGKTVDIDNFAFHPQKLRVKRGARVAFVNSSNVTHTATRAGSFDTRRIAPGSSAVVRFNRRGTFAYHCKIHPFMKGKVVVE